MSAATRQWADWTVAQIQAEDWGVAEMIVHWDDCDTDERRFWIHCWVPAVAKLSGVPHEGNKLVADTARKLHRTAVRLKRELFQQSPFEAHMRPVESPTRRYFQTYGRERKVFSHYEGQTWVYVLSFYGG